MRKRFICPLALIFSLAACKSEKKNAAGIPELPDMKPNFQSRLTARDSTLLLDSFYLLGMIPIHEKDYWTGQKLPLMVISGSLKTQLDTVAERIRNQKIPEASDIERQNDLNTEQHIIVSQLDSLNRLIAKADSSSIVAHAIFYKVTVSKPAHFTTSDSILYVITSQNKIVDWDRSIEKSLDSIVIGKRYRPYDKYFKELQ